MLHGDRDGVEKYEHNDEPVEPLRLYCVPDPEPEPLLSAPKVLVFASGFHFGISQNACGEENSN